MSLNIQNRIGGVNDAEAISDFISVLAKHHIAQTLEPNGIDSLLASMNTTATYDRLCDEYRFILAEVEDKLIGVATIRNPSHLYYLFVGTDHQRQGIGRQLLGHAQEYVYRTTGSNMLTVNSSLNSTEAYHRFGFTKVGDTETIDGVRFQPMRWGNAT
jgi:GNAT superfamily N-acetyltransferase